MTLLRTGFPAEHVTRASYATKVSLMQDYQTLRAMPGERQGRSGFLELGVIDRGVVLDLLELNVETNHRQGLVHYKRQFNTIHLAIVFQPGLNRGFPLRSLSFEIVSNQKAALLIEIHFFAASIAGSHFDNICLLIPYLLYTFDSPL